MTQSRIVYMGFDPRPNEAVGYAVARASIRRHLTQPIKIVGLVLDELREQGLYWREHRTIEGRDGWPVLWDVVSEAPMSTEFAISRFLVPHLAKDGLAIFLDADMLCRADLRELFDSIDPKYAVSVVKHIYQPTATMKMDRQVQSRYPCKNWSSLMVFNCDHPSNKKLTLELINTVPGRDLHRFAWLQPEEIGELPAKWNWLVGHSSATIDPALVHFTEGGPWLPEYANVSFAAEWRSELQRWAR